MKTFTQATVLLLVCCVLSSAQHTDHTSPQSPVPIRLLDPSGFVHMKVSTNNVEAQKYFDQGMTLAYGFNRWDALRSFKRAAELDPSMAMAWWAIAEYTFVKFSGQPDYASKIKESRDAITKALALKAPSNERALIEATALLYSDAEKPDVKALEVAYSAALKSIHESSPNDPDVALTYALSLNSDWSKDGKPLGDTSKHVEVLERSLKRNPKHLGLNHIYIHSVEASSQPERALLSADVIRSFKLNEPELGHLVHMPAHIYVRVGDYQRAAESNQETAKMSNVHMTKEFREWHFSHVFSFLRLSYYMLGNYEKLRANGQASFDFRYPNPTVSELKFREIDLNAAVRFRRWKEILDIPISEAPPPLRNFHYARAFAFAATGKVDEAEEQSKKYLAECKCAPDLVIPDGTDRWEADSMRSSSVNARRLAAKIAEAKGDNIKALDYLQKAVPIEDDISYSEPPLAIEPVRVNLGGLLLRMGRFAEAEKTFRDDLQRTRGNGRSLFGLMKSLEAQGKLKEARSVEGDFRKAWKYSDTVLRIEDL